MYDKKKTKKTMSFATVLCLIHENVYRRLRKITGNRLAAGCQLFYRKIYGYFYSVYLMNETSIHIPCTWLNI